MLADPHTEQAMKDRESQRDCPPRGLSVRPFGADLAARELRHGERPAHEAEHLDERRSCPDDDRERRERRRCCEEDREQRD
jgi:hypothetical protein